MKAEQSIAEVSALGHQLAQNGGQPFDLLPGRRRIDLVEHPVNAAVQDLHRAGDAVVLAHQRLALLFQARSGRGLCRKEHRQRNGGDHEGNSRHGFQDSLLTSAPGLGVEGILAQLGLRPL